MFLIFGLLGGIAEAILLVMAVVGAAIGAMVVTAAFMIHHAEEFDGIKRTFETPLGAYLFVAAILVAGFLAGYVVYIAL